MYIYEIVFNLYNPNNLTKSLYLNSIHMHIYIYIYVQQHIYDSAGHSFAANLLKRSNARHGKVRTHVCWPPYVLQNETVAAAKTSQIVSQSGTLTEGRVGAGQAQLANR